MSIKKGALQIDERKSVKLFQDKIYGLLSV
jgi:hypothetical protein